MSEEHVIMQSSPTLAGIKTGSLFPVKVEDRETFVAQIRMINACLVPKGARLLPLRFSEKKALLYLYRPALLNRDLKDTLARKILSEKNYPVESPGRCIRELAHRLSKNRDFPHEVGLFLGYPSEDVDGFIKNCARCAKCVGTWKVYGDAEKARRKFRQYKTCTRVYCERFQQHNSLEKLVVAVHESKTERMKNHYE